MKFKPYPLNRKFASWFIVLLLAVFLLIFSIRPEEKPVYLTHDNQPISLAVMHGDVKLSNGTNETAADPGKIVDRGIRTLLRTGKGNAGLRFGGDLTVIIDSASLIEINRQAILEPENFFALNILYGRLLLINTQTSRKPDQVFISGHVAVQVFRGVMGVEAPASQPARIDCLLGSCIVNGSLKLDSGQTALISPDGDIQVSRLLSSDVWIALAKLADASQIPMNIALLDEPSITPSTVFSLTPGFTAVELPATDTATLTNTVEPSQTVTVTATTTDTLSPSSTTTFSPTPWRVYYSPTSAPRNEDHPPITNTSTPRVPSKTPVPRPVLSNTPIPTVPPLVNTPVPTNTAVPIPPPTSVPPTDTPRVNTATAVIPTPVNTLEPVNTATLRPTQTKRVPPHKRTPTEEPTHTQAPPPTDTPVPAPTETPPPADTPEPTQTSAPPPTSTPLPTEPPPPPPTDTPQPPPPPPDTPVPTEPPPSPTETPVPTP